MNILKPAPGREAKMGYVMGVLAAIAAVVVIPVHALLTGTTNHLFITYIWLAVRSIQTIGIVYNYKKEHADTKTMIKEIVATSLYFWRPV